MRYYDLQIINAGTGQLFRRYTSHLNGTMNAPDRGALQIEADFIVAGSVQSSANTGGGDFGNSLSNSPCITMTLKPSCAGPLAISLSATPVALLVARSR
jgi:hypothetical protein